MHISDVHDYSEEKPEIVKAFLDDRSRKQLKKEVGEIIDEEFDRLEEYANDSISDTAAGRAEAFVERVLEGDDDAARVLFVSRSDRYRTGGYDNGKPWAHLIHGRLFETRGIQLRRKIVEAHADLIRNERIADLESIIEGLEIQIREQDARISELERRDY